MLAMRHCCLRLTVVSLHIWELQQLRGKVVRVCFSSPCPLLLTPSLCSPFAQGHRAPYVMACSSSEVLLCLVTALVAACGWCICVDQPNHAHCKEVNLGFYPSLSTIHPLTVLFKHQELLHPQALFLPMVCQNPPNTGKPGSHSLCHSHSLPLNPTVSINTCNGAVVQRLQELGPTGSTDMPSFLDMNSKSFWKEGESKKSWEQKYEVVLAFLVWLPARVFFPQTSYMQNIALKVSVVWKQSH